MTLTLCARRPRWQGEPGGESVAPEEIEGDAQPAGTGGFVRSAGG